MKVLKHLFKASVICLFFFGYIDNNVIANQPLQMQKNNEDSSPTIKFENDRFIMENLPQEMVGEENGQWIKEILAILGVSASEADIQYEKNSISFKFSSCKCHRIDEEGRQ